MTRKQRHRRLSHLFTIDAHIPKLDVAGSIPVSRSIFSITYSSIADCNLQENGVTVFSTVWKWLHSYDLQRSDCQRIRSAVRIDSGL